MMKVSWTHPAVVVALIPASDKLPTQVVTKDLITGLDYHHLFGAPNAVKSVVVVGDRGRLSRKETRFGYEIHFKKKGPDGLTTEGEIR